MTTATATPTPSTTDTPVYDAIIIGSGFAGLYAIHKLRDQMGMNVVAFDAAGDVGGTWYWNRYPGARVDIESVHYSYSFSDELQWDWHAEDKADERSRLKAAGGASSRPGSVQGV